MLSSGLHTFKFTCQCMRNGNTKFVHQIISTSRPSNYNLSPSRLVNYNPSLNFKRNYFLPLLFKRNLKSHNNSAYRSGWAVKRWLSQHQTKLKPPSQTTALLYLTSAAVFTVGLSYAAVPLYRIYCQATGYGGTTKQVENVGDKIERLERLVDRQLTIRFEAGTNKKLQWKFKPQQKEVKLTPGETALAFYTAENLTERPIIGIATYNVIPYDAGQYFNKIQCFCFEEQQLNPHEEVDMPVFFYIDPDFDEDPKMAKVDEIILSYTFFESKDELAPVSSPH